MFGTRVKRHQQQFISQRLDHSSYIKHLVLPAFGSPRRNEPSLLLTVNHAPINLLFPLNDANHRHQHGGVTADSYHGPLQYHP